MSVAPFEVVVDQIILDDDRTDHYSQVPETITTSARRPFHKPQSDWLGPAKTVFQPFKTKNTIEQTNEDSIQNNICSVLEDIVVNEIAPLPTTQSIEWRPEELVQRGGILWKVPFSGNSSVRRRWFQVVKTGGETELRWHDPEKSKKKPRSLLLTRATAILNGHQTAAFFDKPLDILPPVELSFSILFPERSVDLAASTPNDLQLWLEGLSFFAKQATRRINIPKEIEYIAPANHMVEVVDSLFHACYQGAKHQFESIIGEFKLDVDLMEPNNTYGDTCLIVACRLGYTEIAEVCLRHGAKNSPHPNYGQTGIQAAASGGNLDCCKLLLETAALSGMDISIVNEMDHKANTPLHVACSKKDPELISLLISHGADVFYTDKLHRTVFHRVIAGTHRASYRMQCLKILFREGADELINSPEKAGNTPIHLAAQTGDKDVVQLLLGAGANPTLTNKDGFTAYHFAMSSRVPECMALIREYEVYYASSIETTKSCISFESQIAKAADVINPKIEEWTQYYNEQGYAYYSSHTTNESQWEDPRDYDVHCFVHAYQRYEDQHEETQYAQTVELTENIGAKIRAELYRARKAERTLMDIGLTTIMKEPNPENFYTCDEKVFFQQGGPEPICNENRSEYYSRRNDFRKDGTRHFEGREYPINESSSRSNRYRKKGVPTSDSSSSSSSESDSLVQDMSHKNSSHKYRPKKIKKRKSKKTNRRSTSSDSSNSGSSNFEINSNKSGSKTGRKAKIEIGSSSKRKSTRNRRIPSSDSSDYSYTDSSNLKMNVNQYGRQSGRKKYVETNSSNSRKPIGKGRIESSDSSEYSNSDSTCIEVNSSKYVRKGDRKASSNEIKSSKTSVNMGRKSSMDLYSNLDCSRQDMKILEDTDAPSSAICKSFVEETLETKVEQNDEQKTTAAPAHEENVLEANELVELYQKYVNMRLYGVAAESVRQKMLVDGITDERIIASVLSTKSNSPSEEEEKISDSSSNSKGVNWETMEGATKYLKMKQLGLAPPAIRQKMQLDVASPDLITAFENAFGIGEQKVEEQVTMTKEEAMSIIEGKGTKYLKMGTMGIPPAAIRQKMLQDQVDNDLLLSFEIVHDLQEKKSDKKKSTRSLVKLHWNTLDMKSVKNTVWAAAASNDIPDEDLKALEALFTAKKAVSMGKTPIISKRKSVISAKRENNVSIGLSQFKKNFTDYDAIAKAISSADTSKLDISKLHLLQTLLPTNEESRAIESAMKNSKEQFLRDATNVEKFFVAASFVVNPALKVSTMLFCAQFPDIQRDLQSKCLLLISASTQIQSSDRLKRVFELILQIGNIMNEGSCNGAASGFTLDSLLKLAETRAQDRKTTVVDYLCKLVEKTGGVELLGFSEDLGDIEMASRLGSGDISKQIKEYSVQFQNIERLFDDDDSLFTQKVQSRVHEMKDQIKSLTCVNKDMDNSLAKAIGYFGENPDTCNSKHMFDVLHKFVSCFNKSKLKFLK